MNDKLKYAPYKKIKLLGQGAFGKAYLAQNLTSKEMVVLKQIDLSRMRESEKRDAYKEAEILKNLGHQNIVEVYDVLKTQSGKLWIIMEYADGGDLEKRVKMRRGRHFREPSVLEWFTQICLSVKHIHDRKIIHRDLKLQNIFMMKNGQVKLGDFGIAKVLDHTRAIAKTMVGTPYYISPEIINSHPYRFETDIWSLGVILYELCCLKPPFQAKSLNFLALKIVKGQYQSPGSMYSRDIKNLIAQLLQVNPKRRPNINQLLANPLLKPYIDKCMSKQEKADEFSHTVLHNQRIKVNQGELKKKFNGLKMIQNENIAKAPAQPRAQQNHRRPSSRGRDEQVQKENDRKNANNKGQQQKVQVKDYLNKEKQRDQEKKELQRKEDRRRKQEKQEKERLAARKYEIKNAEEKRKELEKKRKEYDEYYKRKEIERKEKLKKQKEEILKIQEERKARLDRDKKRQREQEESDRQRQKQRRERSSRKNKQRSADKRTSRDRRSSRENITSRDKRRSDKDSSRDKPNMIPSQSRIDRIKQRVNDLEAPKKQITEYGDDKSHPASNWTHIEPKKGKRSNSKNREVRNSRNRERSNSKSKKQAPTPEELKALKDKVNNLERPKRALGQRRPSNDRRYPPALNEQNENAQDMILAVKKFSPKKDVAERKPRSRSKGRKDSDSPSKNKKKLISKKNSKKRLDERKAEIQAKKEKLQEERRQMHEDIKKKRKLLSEKCAPKRKSPSKNKQNNSPSDHLFNEIVENLDSDSLQMPPRISSNKNKDVKSIDKINKVIFDDKVDQKLKKPKKNVVINVDGNNLDVKNLKMVKVPSFNKEGSEICLSSNQITPQQKDKSDLSIISGLTPGNREENSSRGLFDLTKSRNVQKIEPDGFVVDDKTGKATEQLYGILKQTAYFNDASNQSLKQNIDSIKKASQVINNRILGSLDKENVSDNIFKNIEIEDSENDNKSEEISYLTTNTQNATNLDFITIKKEGMFLKVDDEDPIYQLSDHGQLEDLRLKVEKKVGNGFIELYSQIKNQIDIEDSEGFDELEGLLECPEKLISKLNIPKMDSKTRKAVKMITKFVIKELTLEFSDQQNVSQRFIDPNTGNN